MTTTHANSKQAKRTEAATEDPAARPLRPNLHPDVDPREQVTASILQVMGNPQLVTDADIKQLVGALKAEQKKRLDAAKAALPKVGEAWAIRAAAKSSRAGQQFDVVSAKKTRVIGRFEDGFDVVRVADMERAR